MRELFLGLDCSGETYSAGLWSPDGATCLEASGYTPRKALLEIPAAVAYLLDTAGARAADLSAVGVTRGPGSFTGVRLGITVVKTVALVANCLTLGWDTLELLARQHLPGASSGVVAVALDARRGELYCGLFERTAEGVWKAHMATDVRTPGDFADALRESCPFQVAVGSGFEAYPQLLLPGWRGAVHSDRQQSSPSGLTIARATAALDARPSWVPASELEPVYCRRADIQVSSPPSP